MDNLSIYNLARSVPKEALKEIQAGRLRGKSDINPMWRIKTLTEQFGMCGIGWKYSITKQWLENGGNNEISAFVNIDLYVKINDTWSDAIPGTGGSSFVANERNGLYTSDECFKMALTDAISVSCKALGFGADVYWDKDSTKYNRREIEPQAKPQAKPQQKPESKHDSGKKPVNWHAFWALIKDLGYTEAQVHQIAKTDSLQNWTREALDALTHDLKATKTDAALGDKPEVKPASINRCYGCAVEITEKVRKFSTEKYGEPLCMPCQNAKAKLPTNQNLGAEVPLTNEVPFLGDNNIPSA